MIDQPSNTVATIFYKRWFAIFNVSEVIMNDKGHQFEISLFQSLTKLLGTLGNQRTAYNPASNGILEQFFRKLKNAIKCLSTNRWSEILSIVLLGI